MTATSEIRLALEALATLQAGLGITDPRRIERCKALVFFPPPDKAMPEPITWCNEVSGSRVVHSSGSDRHTYWTVRTQLFVRGPDVAEGAAIALEFYESFLAAVEANLRLGGTLCKSIGIEGGAPSMNPILTWNGESFAGLNLVLNMQTEKAVTLLAPSA